MAGITCRLHILSIHKPGLHSRAGKMPGMATHARAGIRGGRLPAGQEFMPVIVPASAFSTAGYTGGKCALFPRSKPVRGHILVTLEAVLITDRECEWSRLHRRLRIPLERVTNTHQFSLHASKYPWSRMAVDAYV